MPKRVSQLGPDPTFWDFAQTVSWILNRSEEKLNEFVLSPRRARWYGRGADAVLRRAIERGAVTGFDENGRKFKPAAVLGRDPKIRFDSRSIRARWTPSYSLLAGEAAANVFEHNEAASTLEETTDGQVGADTVAVERTPLRLQRRRRGPKGKTKEAAVKLRRMLKNKEVTRTNLVNSVEDGGFKQEYLCELLGVKSRATVTKVIDLVLNEPDFRCAGEGNEIATPGETTGGEAGADIVAVSPLRRQGRHGPKRR